MLRRGARAWAARAMGRWHGAVAGPGAECEWKVEPEARSTLAAAGMVRVFAGGRGGGGGLGWGLRGRWVGRVGRVWLWRRGREGRRGLAGVWLEVVVVANVVG